LSRYIASRMHGQSTPVAAARVIKAHPAPSAAQSFQSLSPAQPISSSSFNHSLASTKSHHVVVVGDSIDAFFHYRNRCGGYHTHPVIFLFQRKSKGGTERRDVEQLLWELRE
jgi:hypothetical protein